MTEKQAVYYELLVLRCQQGRKDALEELIKTWEKRLYYFIRRLLNNEQEAWQVLQETWISVLRSIPRIREPRKLPVWLYSTARKTALNHIRAKYAEQSLMKEVENSITVGEREQNSVLEDAEQVHYGLDQISLQHREVLTLFFLRELSIDDISEVLNVRIGTVKSRLFYAKQALRNALADEDK